MSFFSFLREKKNSYDCEGKGQHFQRRFSCGAPHKAVGALGKRKKERKVVFHFCCVLQTEYPTYYQDSVKEYEVENCLRV